jgi:DNA-binding XRE family transcriptional regulator
MILTSAPMMVESLTREAGTMARKTRQGIDLQLLELGGVRYVIVRESAFDYLCKQAHVKWQELRVHKEGLKPGLDLDGPSLAEKLVRRRVASGLSQAELARRAGIRPETLNRIERGRTTPDFATVRKLVIAMNTAERDQAAQTIGRPWHKESDNASQD